MTAEERLDDTLTGNSEATSGDPVMQWGVRWANQAVTTERDLEAARHAVDDWVSRGVPCQLVSRICGPWTAS